MTVDMNLNRKYFDLINTGTKKLEIRLLDDKRSKLQIGDIIRFNTLNNFLFTKIIDLKIYNSFEDLLNKISPSDVGLSNNKNIALNELYSIYPRDYCINFKILAIKIEKVTVL